MKEKIKYIKNQSDVTTEIEILSKKSLFGEISEDIRDKIIKTFNKFIYVDSTTLFELNEEEYIFENYKTFPEEETDNVNSIFEELVDSSVIGRALQSSQSIIFPEVKDDSIIHNVIIIPLTSENGVNGIVLLNLKKHWDIKSKKYLMYCQNLANYFSLSLALSKKKADCQFLEDSFEQRLSEKMIEHYKSKNDLNTFLDALQTGIFITSIKTGKIYRVNPITVFLTGYSEYELSGMSLSDFMESTNNVIGEHFETYLINRDGLKIPILRKNKIVELRGAEYQIDSFLDITEIKKANDTLSNLNQILEDNVYERTIELEKTIFRLNDEIKNKELAQESADNERVLNSLKSRFISTVSHEFRTPLTIIRTSADLLLTYSNRFTEEQKKVYLERVVNTSDYLSLVLQNILYLQDQDNKLLGSSAFKANLNEILEEVMITLKYKSNLELDLRLNVDKKQIIITQTSGIIKTIFSNIIHNSIIFNKNNNPINIYLNLTKDHVLFKVEDRGIGIPEDEKKNIFELFFRASNIINIPGVGLGLPVVKHCLNIIRGNIDFESKLNQGTVMIVKIPINYEEKS